MIISNPVYIRTIKEFIRDLRRLFIFFIIFMLFFIIAAKCFSADGLVDTDKKMHYVGSVPFGILGAAIIEQTCPEWPWYYKVPAAIGIGMIPGIAKEALDEITYGGADIEDLLADGLGSATGVGIYFTWKW